jgi:hypothetical protein
MSDEATNARLENLCERIDALTTSIESLRSELSGAHRALEGRVRTLEVEAAGNASQARLVLRILGFVGMSVCGVIAKMIFGG